MNLRSRLIRPNSNSQRHFVLTSGYLGGRCANKFRPYANMISMILQSDRDHVETSEIKGGLDTILFAVYRGPRTNLQIFDVSIL